MRSTRASAVEQGTGAAPSPTVRDVLRLLWEADRYPRLGNEDNRAADVLEEEALARAAYAVSCPDDPPEFTNWLAALQDRSLANDDRATIMTVLYDLFDPEDGRAPW